MFGKPLARWWKSLAGRVQPGGRKSGGRKSGGRKSGGPRMSHLQVEALEDRRVPTGALRFAFQYVWNSPGQQTIQPVQPQDYFHKGDTLVIEANADEQIPDPDSDNNTEYCIVTVSGPGQQSTKFQGVPFAQGVVIFHAVAYDGAPIFAELQHPDSDAIATLNVDDYASAPSPPAKPQITDKADLSKSSARSNFVGAIYGLGAVLVGAVGGPAAGALATALNIDAGLLYLKGNYDNQLVQQDPPDANFNVIAQPMPLAVPQVVAAPGQLTARAATALNALFAAEAKEIGIEEAMLTTINRASTAASVGDLHDETYQLQALAHDAHSLAQTLAAEATLRAGVEHALKAEHFPSAALTPQQVAAYQQNIRQNGLPADLLTTLSQLGVAAPTTAQIQQSILSVTPRSAAGNVLNRFVDSTLLANEKAVAVSLHVNTAPEHERNVSRLVHVSVVAGPPGTEMLTVHNVSRQILAGPIVLVFGKLTSTLNPPFHGYGLIQGPDPFVTVMVPQLQPGASFTVSVDYAVSGGQRLPSAVMAGQA
jgi:hypothetical protein